MLSDGKGWVNMVKYSNTYAESRELNILADTMKDGITSKGCTPFIPYHCSAVRKENIYYVNGMFIWE